MKPLHLLASALVALGATQHAMATDWYFSYTGFYNQQTHAFDPGYSISGSFSAEDSNQDGKIESSELTAFKVNGDLPYFTCWQDNGPYHSCGIASFSYLYATKKLQFNVGDYSDDPDGLKFTYHAIHTGIAYSEGVSIAGSTLWNIEYDWTDQTVPVLTVPEPETYAMLLPGLGLIGYAARRRKS